MQVAEPPRPIALDAALAVEYLADALTRERGSIGNRRLDELLDGLVEVTRYYAGHALETLAANPDDDATRRIARELILGAVAVDGVFGRELELLLAKIRPFGVDVPPAATFSAPLGIVGGRVGPRLRAETIADTYLASFIGAPLLIKLCVVVGPLLWLGGFLMILLEGPWDISLPFDLDLPIAVAWSGLGLCAIARWAIGTPKP